jgi:hypothetical protein
MAQLVALLSTGKGTWGEVASLINKPEFDDIYIITNKFGKDTFKSLPNKKINVLVFDLDKDPVSLSKDILNALKPYISFGDIAISIASGSGKEHAALMSAMFKLGTGIRLVSIINNEVVEV